MGSTPVQNPFEKAELPAFFSFYCDGGRYRGKGVGLHRVKAEHRQRTGLRKPICCHLDCIVFQMDGIEWPY
jgi:hypothetical protein